MNQISQKASIYGNLQMGNNVRIDDFCILTGNIKIGNNVHIGAYSFLSGGEGIVIEDYAQISQRVTIYTASDDYSGMSLVGPTIPDKFKPGIDRGPVELMKHVLLGIGTVVMPYLTLFEGACTGAFTFVKHDLPAWGIYVGVPARFLKPRDKRMLELEKEFKPYEHH